MKKMLLVFVVPFTLICIIMSIVAVVAGRIKNEFNISDTIDIVKIYDEHLEPENVKAIWKKHSVDDVCDTTHIKNDSLCLERGHMHCFESDTTWGYPQCWINFKDYGDKTVKYKTILNSGYFNCARCQKRIDVEFEKLDSAITWERRK